MSIAARWNGSRSAGSSGLDIRAMRYSGSDTGDRILWLNLTRARPSPIGKDVPSVCGSERLSSMFKSITLMGANLAEALAEGRDAAPEPATRLSNAQPKRRNRLKQ